MLRMRTHWRSGVCFNAEGGGGAASASAPAGGAGAGAAAAGAGAAAGGTASGGGTGAAAAGGGSGGAAAPWYENADFGFDDKSKQHFAGKNFPDVKTALLSGIEADTLARNRNVIAKPDPQKPGEWEGHELLGWVKDPNKYQIENPKPLAERKDIVIDEGLKDVVRKAAHDARAPVATAQAVFDAMYGHFTKLADETKARGAQQLAETETTLKAKWGNDYDGNVDIASRAMRAFGFDAGEGDLEKLVGAPRVLQMFHQIGTKLGEAVLKTPEGGGSALPNNEAALRAEMSRLEADADFKKSLNDSRHPLHMANTMRRQSIINKISQIQQKASGRGG